MTEFDVRPTGDLNQGNSDAINFEINESMKEWDLYDPGILDDWWIYFNLNPATNCHEIFDDYT